MPSKKDLYHSIVIKSNSWFTRSQLRQFSQKNCTFAECFKSWYLLVSTWKNRGF